MEGSSQDFETLRLEVTRLTQNVARNNKLLQNSLKNPSKLESNPDETNKITQLMHQNNELLLQAKKSAKILQNVNPADPSKINRANLNKQELNKELEKFTKEFQILQKQGRSLLNESLMKAKRRASSDMSSARGDSSVEYGQRDSGQGQQQQQQTMATSQGQFTSIDVDLQIVQERGEQLEQLEQDMVDLQQIYNDINTMVNEQGDLVDDIENNTETAAAHTQDARKEVQKAVGYQTAARRKKFFVFLLAGIAACLIVIIIVLILKVFS